MKKSYYLCQHGWNLKASGREEQILYDLTYSVESVNKQTTEQKKPSVKKRDWTCSGQGRRMRKEGIGRKMVQGMTPNCKVTEC